MSKHTRMMIVEAISENQARDVRNLMDAHCADLPAFGAGFAGSHRLSEDGGNMVVLETTWSTREACIQYHSSRNYRSLVKAIEPYVVGQPVVKLFNLFAWDDVVDAPRQCCAHSDDCPTREAPNDN